MKLTYFDLRVRAEPIRATLFFAKQPFVDERLNKEQFIAKKTDGKLEFGQLPVL